MQLKSSSALDEISGIINLKHLFQPWWRDDGLSFLDPFFSFSAFQ